MALRLGGLGGLWVVFAAPETDGAEPNKTNIQHKDERILVAWAANFARKCNCLGLAEFADS